MGAEKPSILQQLDELSRIRPLTSLEALRLERALRGSERKCGEHWYWSKADLLRLRRHLLNGKKPKDIANLMKRTERSIWRRMNMLGWTIRTADEFSRVEPEYERLKTIWIINPKLGPTDQCDDGEE